MTARALLRPVRAPELLRSDRLPGHQAMSSCTATGQWRALELLAKPLVRCERGAAHHHVFGLGARRGQRAGIDAGEGRGVDLGGGTAAGRDGGPEIFSKSACSVVCRLVTSRLICPRPLESSPMLC
jgi:hypothetical protein